MEIVTILVQTRTDNDGEQVAMYVSNLERGKTTAELGKALKILDVLDVEISFSDRRR